MAIEDKNINTLTEGNIEENNTIIGTDSLGFAVGYTFKKLIAWITNELEKANLKKVEDVLTMAELRTKVGVAGQYKNLLGYYEAGDKPPLLYKWVKGSAVDDGGSVIVNGNGHWKALFDKGVINIRDLGAKCDGVTDDSEYWAKISKLSYDKNTIIEMNANDVSLSKEDINLHRVRKINILGTIILEESKKIILGSRQAITIPEEIYINHIQGSGIVKVQGSKNAQIKINRAEKLELWADGSDSIIGSLAYCKFTLGYVPHIELDGINGGWINSNSFYCNRISKLDIKSDGQYPHNGNTFYNATFENSKINIDSGTANIVLNARLEGTNDIKFGKGASNNIIFRQWLSYKSEYFRTASNRYKYIDNGYSNKVIFWEEVTSEIVNLWNVNNLSENYDVNIFKNISDNRLEISNGDTIFNTDYIDISDVFGIEVITDSLVQFFRCRVTLFDVNKNQLTTKPLDDFSVSGVGLLWNSENNRYENNTTPSNMSFSINKSNEYKFAKIEIYASIGTYSFSYLNINIKKNNRNQLSIPIITEIKELSSTYKPVSLFFKKGTFVKNKGDNINILGWIFNGNDWEDIIKYKDPVFLEDNTSLLSLIQKLKETDIFY